MRTFLSLSLSRLPLSKTRTLSHTAAMSSSSANHASMQRDDTDNEDQEDRHNGTPMSPEERRTTLAALQIFYNYQYDCMLEQSSAIAAWESVNNRYYMRRRVPAVAPTAPLGGLDSTSNDLPRLISVTLE